MRRQDICHFIPRLKVKRTRYRSNYSSKKLDSRIKTILDDFSQSIIYSTRLEDSTDRVVSCVWFERNRLDSDPFNFIPFVGSNRSAVHTWSPIRQIFNRWKVNQSTFVSHPSSSSATSVQLIGRPASPRYPPLQPLPSSLPDRLFQKNLASPWLNDFSRFSFPNIPDNSREAARDFNEYHHASPSLSQLMIA